MPNAFSLPTLSLGMMTFAGSCCADSISYITVDIPGASSTFVGGISNNGIAVGSYEDSSGNTHGFERLANGTLVYPFDDPAGMTFPGVTLTDLHAINNSGTIVGVDGIFSNNAFLLSGNTYTPYRVGNQDAQLTGINDQGDLAGSYVSAPTGQWTPFLQIGNASPISITFPGSYDSFAYGINDLDEVVGIYSVADGNTTVQHGFVRAADGTITTLDGVSDVNDLGVFVGSFGYGTLGDFTPISIPGATSFNTGGINDSGEFVGAYTDSFGVVHGFIAEFTPEPSSIMLSGAGFAGLAALRLRRARMRRVKSHLL